MVTKVTDSEFQNLIQSNNKVVVKYYANWCGTCRLFAPKFTKISNKEEYADIMFLDINAEENPDARQFAGVSNLPFFAVIKDGKLVNADTTSKEESVENMVKQIL
ncbi:MAG: thioredoxin family protein [Bacteroidetes bacterium]|nr:thioredoxin family protein [Bacteroidota bacterium]